MQYIIIDNFFPHLYGIVDELKNREHFDKSHHPEDNAGNWPGKRSLNYAESDPILTHLFLTLAENALPKWESFSLYTHWRFASDANSDWVHYDGGLCTGLVYLSNTNLNSGTQFWSDDPNHNKNAQVILDVPFVQNRFVLFFGNPAHCSKMNYGTNEDDGRFTMNLFMR